MPLMKAFFSMFCDGHNATESLNDASVSHLPKCSTSVTGSTGHDITPTHTAGEVVNEKSLQPAHAVLPPNGSEPLVQQKTQDSRRRRDSGRSCVIAMNADIPSGKHICMSWHPLKCMHGLQSTGSNRISWGVIRHILPLTK